MSIQPNQITVTNINKLVELHNVCMKCQEIYTISFYNDYIGINEAHDAGVALDDARDKFNAYVKDLIRHRC